jgi:hypothetical protein
MATKQVAYFPTHKPTRIKLRYAKKAIIPATLTHGDSVDQSYILYDNEIVKFRYLVTWDNSEDTYTRQISDICKEMYNMDYNRFKSEWYKRVSEIDNVWHLVEMVKV